MSIQRVRTAAGEAQLKQLIQDHVERTGVSGLFTRPGIRECRFVRQGWRPEA